MPEPNTFRYHPRCYNHSKLIVMESISNLAAQGCAAVLVSDIAVCSPFRLFHDNDTKLRHLGYAVWEQIYCKHEV